MPNFSYVIDSSFNPFSFQEMLAPLAMYKDAYEKSEQSYLDLQDKADKYKYLSENLPRSKAKDIYENYANELNKQAEDLSRNGLSMNNRKALLNLKRRYSGEIGILDKAQAALDKEKELRRAMSAKDPSMLYGVDNLNIDDYLYDKTPNLYSISGTELYTKAAAAGKSAASKIYSAGDTGSTLGGYYRDYVERMGYTPQQLAQFSNEIMEDFTRQVSVLPELQQAANQILEANGVNENLTGINLRKAQQQVIRGLIDGSVYTEKHDPKRDLGVKTAAEKASDDRAKEAAERAQEEWNIKKQAYLDERMSMYNFLKDKEGNYVDEKGNPLKEGQLPVIDPKNPYNSNINRDNYELDPNGKWKPKKKTTQSPEEKARVVQSNQKQAALLELDSSSLANNNGFDVTFGGTDGTAADRHHYNYMGALSKHGNDWYEGAIGDKNDGHWGWGFASTSNVENAFAKFSAEGSDSETWYKIGRNNKMRVLSPSELESVLASDSGLLDAFNKRVKDYCKKHNIDPDSEQADNLDIQLIEVPNEIGGGDQKGYLIAVH